MARNDAENTTSQAVDVGAEILSWETWETSPVERSTRWYVIAGTLGLGLLLYAVLTANFVFAVIVLMFAIITFMADVKKPSRVPVHITTAGIVFDHDFFRFEDIRDFSIAYEPPSVAALYLTFHSRTRPMLSIPLDNASPNDVREALLPFAFENLARDGESLTDILHRVYKL